MDLKFIPITQAFSIMDFIGAANGVSQSFFPFFQREGEFFGVFLSDAQKKTFILNMIDGKFTPLPYDYVFFINLVLKAHLNYILSYPESSQKILVSLESVMDSI